MKNATNADDCNDRNSRDAQVAGALRSPILRLLRRSYFLATEKTPELLPLDAADCPWGRLKENNQESRTEAQRLAMFNQAADLSTHRRKISVRTTRATAEASRASSTWSTAWKRARCISVASPTASTRRRRRAGSSSTLWRVSRRWTGNSSASGRELDLPPPASSDELAGGSVV